MSLVLPSLRFSVFCSSYFWYIVDDFRDVASSEYEPIERSDPSAAPMITFHRSNVPAGCRAPRRTVRHTAHHPPLHHRHYATTLFCHKAPRASVKTFPSSGIIVLPENIPPPRIHLASPNLGDYHIHQRKRKSLGRTPKHSGALPNTSITPKRSVQLLSF